MFVLYQLIRDNFKPDKLLQNDQLEKMDFGDFDENFPRVNPSDIPPSKSQWPGKDFNLTCRKKLPSF